MEQTIRLTESQFKKLITETVKKVLKEDIKSTKLMDILKQHGTSLDYLKRTGGIKNMGSLTDDDILGVGKVDTHVHPHEPLNIDGYDDKDVESTSLGDGYYLYYNRRSKFLPNNSGRGLDGEFKRYTVRSGLPYDAQVKIANDAADRINNIKTIYNDINTNINKLLNVLKRSANKTLQDKVYELKNEIIELNSEIENESYNISKSIKNPNTKSGGYFVKKPDGTFGMTPRPYGVKARDNRGNDSIYNVKRGSSGTVYNDYR